MEKWDLYLGIYIWWCREHYNIGMELYVMELKMWMGMGIVPDNITIWE